MWCNKLYCISSNGTVNGLKTNTTMDDKILSASVKYNDKAINNCSQNISDNKFKMHIFYNAEDAYAHATSLQIKLTDMFSFKPE